jgi:hypothetical protein
MIKCKIGLISIPHDGNIDNCLYLGEVFDKRIKNDKNILYELHSNLRFLYPLKIKVKDGVLLPDNLEDIREFQTKYKLTRKIYMTMSLYNNTYKYTTPQLYDLSCMLPLFNVNIPRCVYPHTTNESTRVFILLPYLSPITRGELVDRCMTMISYQTSGLFFSVGKINGCNHKSTGDLYRRYLISCGVEDDNIYKINHNEYPYCITEALVFVDLITGGLQSDIYLCVSNKDMGKILDYVKFLKKANLIHTDVKFLCN